MAPDDTVVPFPPVGSGGSKFAQPSSYESGMRAVRPLREGSGREAPNPPARRVGRRDRVRREVAAGGPPPNYEKLGGAGGGGGGGLAPPPCFPPTNSSSHPRRGGAPHLPPTPLSFSPP